MAEIERILPTTKVSEWLASTITGLPFQPPPTGNAGYFAGGGWPWTDSIDRIDFDDDTKFTLSATLARGRGHLSAVSNSGVAGYLWGGKYNDPPTNAYPYDTRIEKLTFSGDTMSIISATLATGVTSCNCSSFSNVGTAGYLAGGNV
jgi:hypothetical protein